MVIFGATAFVEFQYGEKNFIYYGNQKEIIVVQFAASLLFIIYFHNALVRNNEERIEKLIKNYWIFLVVCMIAIGVSVVVDAFFHKDFEYHKIYWSWVVYGYDLVSGFLMIFTL